MGETNAGSIVNTTYYEWMIKIDGESLPKNSPDAPMSITKFI